MAVKWLSGTTDSFAPWRAQRRHGASAADLAEGVLGVCFGLRWTLDVDLTVPGLLNGVFGMREWMDRLRVAEGIA